MGRSHGQTGADDWGTGHEFLPGQPFARRTDDRALASWFRNERHLAETPTPFAQTAAEERSGAFSPDGHWYAYVPDEAGQSAVFVRAFPGPGRSWRVSSGAGERPFWRADGGEMYYEANRQLMAVPVTVTGGALDFGDPAALFPLARTDLLRASTDGRRFLVATDAEDVQPSPLTVIVNWSRGAR